VIHFEGKVRGKSLLYARLDKEANKEDETTHPKSNGDDDGETNTTKKDVLQ
jgi:hypothetical protein